jgi:hypothetical protein
VDRLWLAVAVPYRRLGLTPSRMSVRVPLTRRTAPSAIDSIVRLIAGAVFFALTAGAIIAMTRRAVATHGDNNGVRFVSIPAAAVFAIAAVVCLVRAAA